MLKCNLIDFLWQVLTLPSWWFQPFWKIYISQIGNLPQVGVKIKNIWNHHLATISSFKACVGLWNSSPEVLAGNIRPGSPFDFSYHTTTIDIWYKLEESFVLKGLLKEDILLMVQKSYTTLGCIKLLKIMIIIHHINWWSPDFWTINSR